MTTYTLQTNIDKLNKLHNFAYFNTPGFAIIETGCNTVIVHDPIAQTTFGSTIETATDLTEIYIKEFWAEWEKNQSDELAETVLMYTSDEDLHYQQYCGIK